MIKLQNVHKSYKLDDDVIFTALKSINLEIKQGEFTSIIGPSGSGKSTLIKSIMYSKRHIVIGLRL